MVDVETLFTGAIRRLSGKLSSRSEQRGLTHLFQVFQTIYKSRKGVGPAEPDGSKRQLLNDGVETASDVLRQESADPASTTLWYNTVFMLVAYVLLTFSNSPSSFHSHQPLQLLYTFSSSLSKHQEREHSEQYRLQSSHFPPKAIVSAANTTSMAYPGYPGGFVPPRQQMPNPVLGPWGTNPIAQGEYEKMLTLWQSRGKKGPPPMPQDLWHKTPQDARWRTVDLRDPHGLLTLGMVPPQTIPMGGAQMSGAGIAMMGAIGGGQMMGAQMMGGGAGYPQMMGGPGMMDPRLMDPRMDPRMGGHGRGHFH